jgi:hypothetical protein
MTTTQKDQWAAKSERRAAWAQAAETKAAAIFSAQPNRDWAFMSQPGHIPARARDIAQTDRAVALLAKAAEHSAKAEQLARMASTTKGDAERARQIVRDGKTFEAGQAVVSVHYGAATVLKVNAKSVRIRLASGFETTQDKSYLRAAQ